MLLHPQFLSLFPFFLFGKLDLSINTVHPRFCFCTAGKVSVLDVHVYCSTYIVHNFIGFLLFIVQFDNVYKELACARACAYRFCINNIICSYDLLII